MTTTTLLPAVDLGMREVEALLLHAVHGFPHGLADACGRVAFAGGKRLRARLVVQAAATAGGTYDEGAVHRCAAAVELLHCATLVHDDLMDGALTRRGVPTINALEGPAMSVLAGDGLIGAASRMATGVSQQAGLVLAETLEWLCRGQALEEHFRFDPSVTETDVLGLIEGKTGSLLSAACSLGAEAGGASESARRAYGEFGMAFGICLQLIDDTLDLVSTESLYGKPVAGDFLSGRVTMPAVTALQEQPALRSLLRPGLTPADQQRALRLLRGATGVVSTIRQAYALAAQAHVRIAGLGNGASAMGRFAAMPRNYCARQLHIHVAPAYRHVLSCADAGLDPVMR
jgi:geranylgeranyl pyrophosphate synthase